MDQRTDKEFLQWRLPVRADVAGSDQRAMLRMSGGFVMQSGIVKWFNNAKGYGFILSEACEEELFAHFSAIVMDGYKSLKAGQKVLFEIQQGPKGLHAVNIQPVE
jgi:CspA family cold shock protein